jgi:CRISPR-associated protein (TIGR02584 family)
MERAPHEYAKRIMLAAAGKTPQVVTETLYALGVGQTPAFVPTEVHVVTTAEGAARARLTLLGNEPGWFRRLCADYGLEGIRFDAECIHVLRGAEGEALEDIRTEEDNRAAADAITELVRRLTEDPEAALHVSIAGGRKTMGFYLGYALSLYGREQDRLSHVLAPAPFESHPEFYYPTRESRVIYTAGPDSRPLDTAAARVALAEIPFVRLRHGLPERLLRGQSSFVEAVEAAQRRLGPVAVVIDLKRRRIAAGGVQVKLPPAELAFYSWLARRKKLGLGTVECPSEGAPEAEEAEEFLKEYRAILGEMGADERTSKALAKGMEKGYFLERRSKVNGRLKAALGWQAEGYMIRTAGRRPRTVYEVGLEAEQIKYEGE